MTECPPERHAGFLCLREEAVNTFASRHAQLSPTGQRILDGLLLLLPTHLKSQSMSHSSPFPSALLYSICAALQLDCTDSSAGQYDPSILPSVLRKLRDWRLLEPGYRYSLGGILELALDLARITDEASAPTSSDLNSTSRAHLRVRWVGSDSPSKNLDQESSSLPTPPSPSSSLSLTLGVVQEGTHSLPDPNGRRLDNESCHVDKPSTLDSEDASAVVSPRHLSVFGFRSGCSACRHPRLLASAPFSSVNRSDVNIASSVSASPRHLVPSAQRATTKKTKRDKPKCMQPVSRGAHVDENEPPVPKPMGSPHGISILSPRQRTHSPRISNTHLSREPFASVAASAQRRLESSHFSNPARQGDKHISSRRIAFVDLRLSMANPSPRRASPNDRHPHAQRFSYTPVKDDAHRLGADVGARVPTLSPNAPTRSSKRLPSWNPTHLVRHPTTTTTVTSPGSLLPPRATARLGNPRLGPSMGERSSPSSTSIRPVKHRNDRRSVSSSQKHAHVGVLPLSSPRIHARK